MFVPCKFCPNLMGCQRHGCFAWNDVARQKIKDDQKRLDEEYEKTVLDIKRGARMSNHRFRLHE